MGSSDMGNGGGSAVSNNGSNFAGQTYCLRWNNHKSNLVEILEALIKMECYVDCTIHLENQVQFKAHRVVLAANSPYLQSILQDVQMDHWNILFPGVQEFEMRVLLEYMYTGEVNVTKSQIPKIMKIAETLEITGLYDITELKSRFEMPPQHQTPTDMLSPTNFRETSRSATAELRRDKDFEHDFERERMREREIERSREEIEREFPPLHHQLHQSSPTVTTSGKISSTQSNASPPFNYRSPHAGHYTRSPVRDSNGSSDRLTHLSAQWSLSPHHMAAQNQIRTAASMLNSVYETGADMNPLKRKKLSSNNYMTSSSSIDTPILRNVLAQSNPTDSSQNTLPLLVNPNNGNTSSTNNNNNNNSSGSSFGGRKSGSHHSSNGSDHSDKKYNDEPQSPFTDKSFEDDQMMERKHSPPDYGGDPGMPAFLQHLQQQQQQMQQQGVGVGGGGGGGAGSQKPEWKRYKQYTRSDILSAIECVRNGMSALQASRKFGVPSRTLYDKVKKLGITTGTPRNRTIKRESGASSVSGSGAPNTPFPYGLSGAGFGLYGVPEGPISHDERPELENQPPSLGLHPMFDPTFIQQALAAAVNGISNNQNRVLNAAAATDRSPSPNVLIRYIHNHSSASSQQNQNSGDDVTPIKNEPRDYTDDDDDAGGHLEGNTAEDLSMNKHTMPVSRTPSPVPAPAVIPPSPTIAPSSVITETNRSSIPDVPSSPAIPLTHQQQGVIVVPPIKFASPRSEPPSSTSPPHSDKDNFKMDMPLMPAAVVGHDDQ